LTRIKVSGISEPADAEMAVALGVDIVACVFYAGSPRYVTATQAMAIRRVLPPAVSLAGIFVDTPTPLVQRLTTLCNLDLVQLFGAEPRSTVEALGATAFKAITVSEPASLTETVQAFLGRRGRSEHRPAFLLHLAGDLAHAWDVAAEPAAQAPILLASTALDARTAADAIGTTHPWGLDVWEGVEREPGRLEPARVAEFVAAVREADHRAEE